jgi:hypothetical protein
MNVLGLFLLLFVLVGAFMGAFFIASNTNTTPIDSYGNTISANNSRMITNATPIMMVGTATIPWIAFLVVILIIVGVFLWTRSKSGSGGYNNSRYH